MGKQAGPHYITGTVGDRTYYRLNGQYLVRAKSTLSRKRVKRSPAFRTTMEYAGLLGHASKLAVGVYRMISRNKQRVHVYRKMTGVAMGMLKTGMDEEQVRAQLIREYVPKIVVKPVVERPRKQVALFGAGQRQTDCRNPAYLNTFVFARISWSNYTKRPILSGGIRIPVRIRTLHYTARDW